MTAHRLAGMCRYWLAGSVGMVDIGVMPDHNNHSNQSRVHGRPMPRARTSWIVLVAVGAVFLGAAVWIRPLYSAAQSRSGTKAVERVESRVSSPLLLGEMVGRNYVVRVYSGEDEPRYTVCTLGGESIIKNLYADEVYTYFPNLDIESMQFGPEDLADEMWSPLMMVDHDR